jgi:Helicase associated domain
MKSTAMEHGIISNEEEVKTELKLESSIYQYLRWKISKLQRYQNQQKSDDATNDTQLKNPCSAELKLTIEKYERIIYAFNELGTIDKTIAFDLSLDDIPTVLVGFYSFLKNQEDDVDCTDDSNENNVRKRKPQSRTARTDVEISEVITEEGDGVGTRKKTCSDTDEQKKKYVTEAMKLKILQESADLEIANLKAKLQHLQENMNNPLPSNDNQLQPNVNPSPQIEIIDLTTEEMKCKSRRDEQWEVKFQQVAAYIAKHGVNNLSKLNSENPRLSDWCSTQRSYYVNKLKVLTATRIERLNAINFPWTAPLATNQTIPYETRIQQCKQFKELYGHLTVPLLSEPNFYGAEPTEEEKRFRMWAQTVRIKYHDKKRSLNAVLLRSLKEIEFDFGDPTEDDLDDHKQSQKEDRFADRVKQLQTIVDVWGSCNEKKYVISVYPDNPPLLKWIQLTRRMYHKWTRGEPSTLTDERRKMLEDVGFDFNPRRHYAPPKTTRYKNYKSLQLKETLTYMTAVDDKDKDKVPVQPSPPPKKSNTRGLPLNTTTERHSTATGLETGTLNQARIEKATTNSIPTTTTRTNQSNNHHHQRNNNLANIEPTPLPVWELEESHDTNGMSTDDSYISPLEYQTNWKF